MERKWTAVLQRLQTGQSEDASWAVRLGAPIPVLNAWFSANPRALVRKDSQNGSILHEAWKCNSKEHFAFVLERVLAHQKNSGRSDDLLAAQDRWGRTILHYLVQQPQSTASWIRRILQASPSVAEVVNFDGHTPLLVLLDYSSTHSRWSHRDDIAQAVKLILEYCPKSASTGRLIPRRRRFLANTSYTTAKREADATMSPLYYAILHGHSESVVQSIISQMEDSDEASIVSPHDETALHVALSTTVPMGILRQLVKLEGSSAVSTRDSFGWTPLDWLWMKYLVDQNSTHQTDELSSSRVISRRRLLPAQFPAWYLAGSRWESIQESRGKQNRELLVQSLKILTGASKRDLLLRLCSQSTPIGLVRVALAESERSDILHQDAVCGRCSVHYAAEQYSGYESKVPVGSPNQKLWGLKEKPFFALSEMACLFPEVCSMTDRTGQLPLHIVIEAGKRSRQRNKDTSNEPVSPILPEENVIGLLLSHWPFSLRERDGLTGLYPWQQAAVGSGAATGIIYSLLRRDPTFLTGEGRLP